MTTQFGRLFVQHHHDPSADVAAEIMARLRAVDPADRPPDAVVITRTLSTITRLEHATHLLREGRDMSPMSDYACLADAMGLLTEDDVDSLLPLYDPIYRDGLLRQRILRLVRAGRLDDAHTVAEQMTEPLQGHRDVGHHLAKLGDHRSFFAEWPRYEPRRATQQLVEMRLTLVAAIGRRDGARAALHIVETHKRLGEKYVVAALASAELAPYDELLVRLDGELANRVDESARCSLLVDQMLRELPIDPEEEDPRVLPLAERIGRLDGDRGVRRHRDNQLFRLWPVLGDPATLKRVRALVRTPSIRRELTRLPREVTGPGEA